MKKNKGRAPSFLKILRKSSFFSHYLTLMIICNLAVYIPFSCISYFAMQNMTQGNINTVATQNMYEFKTSFDKINTEIMGIYNSIVSNEEINSALNSGTVQNSIARNLKNYIILDPCISAVEYFDIEHSHLYSTMVSGGEEKIEGSPWYAAYKEGHKNFVTSYTEKFANREEHYIIIFREVWANYNRMSGGVVFYINMVNYESQVLVPAIGNQKYFYIADNEGMILYSNKYETIGMKQTEDTAEKKKVIDDSALKCMCLPITIQPLIENAVQHGMRKSMTVDIIVKHIQDKIVIEVSDNGIGITPERLAEIRSRLDNPDELRTKNLGMSNINSRYLLLYGDAYTLTIQSVPNEKTTVRIEIPAENA